jgi:hypothetical protein
MRLNEIYSDKWDQKWYSEEILLSKEKRPTMSERDYYTAREAQKVLGLSNASFHRWVGEGKIKKYMPPGRERGIYPKRDIDALARAMKSVFEQQDKIVFSRSTPADQEQEMHIGIRCFGEEFITPLPERIAFQQKSEYTFWSLKVDDQVVGYISMFRFPPDFLDDLLTGRRIEREITTRIVLPFKRLESFVLYIDVLATDPRLSHHLRTLYANFLVIRFADTILNFLGNGYFIRALYTVTATREGDNLVNKAGFRKMEGKSIVPGRTAYEFILDDVGIEKLKEFSHRGV